MGGDPDAANFQIGHSMDADTILNECKDPTQSITIELPCALAQRVMKLAEENDTSLSNILIEALDAFLRNQE